MKVGVLCGVVALGAGMFVGCEEQNAEKANPALQGTTISALQSSINPALQKFAEEALRDGIAQYGTARRAAIEGVKIAGKTGTAQKRVNGVWQPGLYRASFVGIVPADDPKYVIYVMLDFDRRAPYHQGGNSAGPVWRRIAMKALGLEA